MTALWTARDAATATGSPMVSGAVWTADGVSIDSRNVAPRDLFVALKGPRFDGHDYVAGALGAGAAAAMVDHAMPGIDPARLLAVTDTQAGLEALARAARARSTGRILAVPGSVGKTGPTEALAKVLGTQGSTYASTGNLNNHIGTPLSLARLPADARFGVFELGMNHAGEIAPLSKMVRPDVAIVTTVEAVHLEYFESVEAIADAKAEIFAGMDSNGVAILPRDNPHFDRLAGHARTHGVEVRSFGAAASADARLVSVALTSDGSTAEAEIVGRHVAFSLPLPGRHHVLNALAVLLAVGAAGGDIEAAAASLANLSFVKGRGARQEVVTPAGAFLVVDESYNASPAAMRAAIAVLAMTGAGTKGRRIAVLGDMLELGAAGPAEHAGLAETLVQAGVSQVFTAGPLMRHLHDALPAALRGAHAIHSAELAPVVTGAVGPGDVVLVKGSAGSRMGVVVSSLLQLGNAEARRAV